MVTRFFVKAPAVIFEEMTGGSVTASYTASPKNRLGHWATGRSEGIQSGKSASAPLILSDRLTAGVLTAGRGSRPFPLGQSTSSESMSIHSIGLPGNCIKCMNLCITQENPFFSPSCKSLSGWNLIK